MPVSDDCNENADRICTAIDQAAEARAEILLTPEGSVSGYRPDFSRSELAAALERVTTRARQHAIGLALGTCFVEADGKCYNQVRFYRPNGDYLGFHGKTLLCSTLDPVPEGEINHYALSGLRVFEWAAGLTIGGLICNDLWANPDYTTMPDPHLTQRLAEMGAQVIFHAVNGGRDGSEGAKVNWQYHEANLRLRAHAGDVWIVTVDNAHPSELPCSAPSGVIDPAGNWACRAASMGSQLFCCTLDLSRGGRRDRRT